MNNKPTNSENTGSIFKHKFIIGPLVAGITTILIAVATPVGERVVGFIFPTSAVVVGIVQKDSKPVPKMKISLDETHTKTTSFRGKFLFTNVSSGEHTIRLLAEDGSLLGHEDFNVGKGVEKEDLGIIPLDSIPIATKPNKVKASQKNTAFVVEQKSATYQVDIMHKATLIPVNERRSGYESNTRKVNVWVTGTEQGLPNIERVTYYLHPTFNPSVVTRYSHNNNFGLSFTAWGQFEIKAKVYFKNGKVKDLSRYLSF